MGVFGPAITGASEVVVVVIVIALRLEDRERGIPAEVGVAIEADIGEEVECAETGV